MEGYEVYFELPGVGDLMLEHSFYQLDGEPILFVCKDAKETRFLCSCYQMDRNWVIGQATERALVDLIDDKITIRGAFEQCCSAKWTAAWDGNDLSYASNVSDDVLPRKGAFLELPRERNGQYKEVLMKKLRALSLKIDETYRKMVAMTAQSPVSGWVSEMDALKGPVSVSLPHISRQGPAGKESENTLEDLPDSFPAAA